MFRLSFEEVEALNRSQFATGSQKHRDPRFTPLAFIEHGTMMAGFMLNSPHAVDVSVYVVHAFSVCAKDGEGKQPARVSDDDGLRLRCLAGLDQADVIHLLAGRG